MIRKALAAALAAAAVTAGSAWAITYGEPDGTAHPNVGALIAEIKRDGGKAQFCSGTLVSPTVFVTAAHCTAYLESRGIPNDRIWVSFDVDVSPLTTTTKLHRGTWHTHPGYYTGTSANSYDLAVVVLDRAVKGTEPARLPQAGLFDRMKADGTLAGATFTSVGYGVHEPEVGGGPASFPYDGERWRSVGSFSALNETWLRLSQNAATGDGGTCYGDSGGPNFLGSGATETNILASITVTGDAMCRATNTTYRLDTPYARDFLARFVTLP